VSRFIQLYFVLNQVGSRPNEAHRVTICLTKAGFGGHDSGDIKPSFPEMRDEFDASQKVKLETKIIVIPGNSLRPFYWRRAG
jgi:hypothetical protein